MSHWSDWLKAHIRTAVPIGVGFVAAYLVDALAEKLGITIDGELAYALVFGATAYLVYAAGTWLERRRWKPARLLGRLLVSLGLVAEKPTYPQPPAPGTVRPLGAMRQPDGRHTI